MTALCHKQHVACTPDSRRQINILNQKKINKKIRSQSTFFFFSLQPLSLSLLSLVRHISSPATLGAKEKKREPAAKWPSGDGRREGGGLGNSLTTLISTKFILGTGKSCDLMQPSVDWRGTTEWILSAVAMQAGIIGLQSDRSGDGCWQINPWREDMGRDLRWAEILGLI